MDEETDQHIADIIKAAFHEIWIGTKQLVAIDGIESDGRPYESWHNELVEKIDAMRANDGISADKAAKQICDPYLKEHYITYESLIAAYWRRRPEFYKDQFLRAIADRDLPAAVIAYKPLPDDFKAKITAMAQKFC